MDFSIINNLLSGVRFLESPNQSERSADTQISLLVIHNISLPPGEYETGCIDQLFCNQLNEHDHPFFAEIADLRVSAHVLIARSGEITQYVPFDKKAWHAGESHFCDVSDCNDFSIGIELEGTDFEEFTSSQYQSLIAISKLLIAQYPTIKPDRIVGHSDIAPERKTDPGPHFDWRLFKSSFISGTETGIAK